MLPWAHPTQRVKRPLDRFSRFGTLHGRDCLLYNGLPVFPSKMPLRMCILSPSSTRFFGPTRTRKPNDISIGPAVFTGLTIVTDRPYATRSITVGRIFVAYCDADYNNKSYVAIGTHGGYRGTLYSVAVTSARHSVPCTRSVGLVRMERTGESEAVGPVRPRRHCILLFCRAE